MKNRFIVLPIIGLCVGVIAGRVAGAQPAPNYDFSWSTIGDPGNAPYVDNDPDYGHQVVNGRGRVDYEYRMSTLEITTGQWMEFLNAFGGPNGSPNQFWQARPAGWWNADPVAPDRYELRTDVPNAGQTPGGWHQFERCHRFRLYSNGIGAGGDNAPHSAFGRLGTDSPPEYRREIGGTSSRCQWLPGLR